MSGVVLSGCREGRGERGKGTFPLFFCVQKKGEGVSPLPFPASDQDFCQVVARYRG